jgi:peptidyl-prolyl cis-trans isomerase NIMA-interacting 1
MRHCTARLRMSPSSGMHGKQMCSCPLTQSHSGQGATETVPIDKQPAYVIGRQPDTVDITLDEPSASRQHAALVHHEDGRLFLIDLGSVSSCCRIAS